VSFFAGSPVERLTRFPDTQGQTLEKGTRLVRRVRRDNPPVADAARMIFLGFGKYARADKIYALEPLPEGERGHGRRTRVWIEGVPDPIVASRTERTILHDMGHDAAAGSPLLDDALDLAERLVEQTQAGRVDLGDLSRRARRLLEASTPAPDESKLF
jgi:hypothetical protein